MINLATPLPRKFGGFSDEVMRMNTATNTCVGSHACSPLLCLKSEAAGMWTHRPRFQNSL